jgi:hypothetical protein
MRQQEAAMLAVRQSAPSLLDRFSRSFQDWRELAALSARLSGLDAGQVRTVLEREGWIASASPNPGVQILWRLMRTLGLNVGRVRQEAPRTLASLEATCAACTYRSQCELMLAQGTAQESYAQFCPNAKALNALRA